MVKKCPSCSYNNRDDAIFCSNCGASLAGLGQALKTVPPALEVKPVTPGEPIQVSAPGQCFYHPNLPAVYVCNRCGRSICGDDSKTYMDLVLCPQCYVGVVPSMALQMPTAPAYGPAQMPAAPAYGPAYAPPPMPAAPAVSYTGPFIAPYAQELARNLIQNLQLYADHLSQEQIAYLLDWMIRGGAAASWIRWLVQRTEPSLRCSVCGHSIPVSSTFCSVCGTQVASTPKRW